MKHIRTYLCTFAALSLALSCVAVAHATDAAAASSTSFVSSGSKSSKERAFADLATCIRSKKSLNVLYLVDESGSIKQTDPRGERANILADSLRQLSEFDGEKNFSVVTFADTTVVRRDWQVVSDSSVSRQSEWLRSSAGKWETNGWTNWLSALTTVSSQFSQAPNADGSCKALIWVTDGGIALSRSGSDKYDQNLTAQAIAQLCAHNPASGNQAGASLIHSLRRSQVSVFGVLFQSKAYLASKSPAERADELSRMSYMRAMVEGAGNVNASAFGGPSSLPFSCPTKSLSKKVPAGALLEASDPLALAYQFAKISIAPKNGTEAIVSAGAPNRFNIEPGVASFDLLVPSPEWVLKDPNGKKVADNRGEADSSATVLSGQVATVSVQVSSEQQGQWILSRKKTSQPTALYLYSGLDINLEKSDFVAGDKAQISGSIVSANPDASVDLGEYGTSDLKVKAIDVETGDGNSVILTLNPDGTFEGEFVPEPSRAQVTFDVSLALTTKSGLKLLPITKRFEQPVKLPEQFPSIAWSKFTPLNHKHGTADATVTISGSKSGNGQVCFETPKIVEDSNPDRMDSFVLSGTVADLASERQCLDIAAGATRTETLKIGNTTPADGLIEGIVPVTFKSAVSTGDEIHQVSEFAIVSQIIPGNPWPSIIAATILGMLFALALFYFMSWRASRLSIANITVARVKAKVTLGSPISKIVRADGTEGPLLRASGLDGGDFKPIPADLDRVREWIPAGGAETIRAMFPKNPFGRISAKIQAPAGTYVVGQSIPTFDVDKRQAGIELNPANSFYLLVSESSLTKAPILAGVIPAVQSSSPFGDIAPQAALSADEAVELGDVVEVEIVAFVTKNSDEAIANLNQAIERSGLFENVVTLAEAQSAIAKPASSTPDIDKGENGRTRRAKRPKKQEVAAASEPTMPAASESDPNNPFGGGPNVASPATSPSVIPPDNSSGPKNPFAS